jgi:single stranded DNA-binding protein
MQTIIVSGRLGREAKIYQSSNGAEFISFTMASNSKIKNAEKTTWWDILVFDVDKFKRMVPHLTKGTSVIVNGELDPQMRKDQNGQDRMQLTIMANAIHFNSTGGTQQGGQQAQAASQNTNGSATAMKKTTAVEDIAVTGAKPAPTPVPTNDPTEDDLPF